MIVESMTHAEVYRELERDRENLRRWMDHAHDRNRRKTLRLVRFPALWWLEYTSPRHITYHIEVVVTRRKYDLFHYTCVITLRKEQRGYTVYLTGATGRINKTVFVQHVFDRYAERTHLDTTGMTKLDVIKRMIDGITGGGTIVEDQTLAGRSVRYNGRDHLFIAIDEGMMLGDMEDGIFIARTFITYDMTTGRQAEEFTYAKSKLNSVEEEMLLARQPIITPTVRMNIKK